VPESMKASFLDSAIRFEFKKAALDRDIDGGLGANAT